MSESSGNPAETNVSYYVYDRCVQGGQANGENKDMKHDTKCGLRIYRGSNEWPKVELRRVVAAISGCFSVFLNCVSHVAISDASSKGAAGARLSPSTSHFERRAAKRVLTVRGKIPPVPVPTCARIPLASAAVVDTDPSRSTRPSLFCRDRPNNRWSATALIFCRSKKIGLVGALNFKKKTLPSLHARSKDLPAFVSTAWRK